MASGWEAAPTSPLPARPFRLTRSAHNGPRRSLDSVPVAMPRALHQRRPRRPRRSILRRMLDGDLEARPIRPSRRPVVNTRGGCLSASQASMRTSPRADALAPWPRRQRPWAWARLRDAALARQQQPSTELQGPVARVGVSARTLVKPLRELCLHSVAGTTRLPCVPRGHQTHARARPKKAHRNRAGAASSRAPRPDHVCRRTPGPHQAFAVLGPDLGEQLATLLMAQQRLDRFAMTRLASACVHRAPVAPGCTVRLMAECAVGGGPRCGRGLGGFLLSLAHPQAAADLELLCLRAGHERPARGNWAHSHAHVVVVALGAVHHRCRPGALDRCAAAAALDVGPLRTARC